MPYYIGYKMSADSSKIFVYSFKDYSEAQNQYDRLMKKALPEEIFIHPLHARTEEEALEEARKLIL